MSERLQTLVMCDFCGCGYPAREMRVLDGESLACKECDPDEEHSRPDDLVVLASDAEDGRDG